MDWDLDEVMQNARLRLALLTDDDRKAMQEKNQQSADELNSWAEPAALTLDEAKAAAEHTEKHAGDPVIFRLPPESRN